MKHSSTTWSTTRASSSASPPVSLSSNFSPLSSPSASVSASKTTVGAVSSNSLSYPRSRNSPCNFFFVSFIFVFIQQFPLIFPPLSKLRPILTEKIYFFPPTNFSLNSKRNCARCTCIGLNCLSQLV
jgi:hypothetical protein